jgi:hypothetical protein
MSGENDERDHPKPLNLCGEDASGEDVIAVLWQGVTVVFFPDEDHVDWSDRDDTVAQGVEILGGYAKVFGMRQLTRTLRDGFIGWLEVQWCWETAGDATCATPYVPDGMESLSGPLSGWSRPFLAQ